MCVGLYERTRINDKITCTFISEFILKFFIFYLTDKVSSFSPFSVCHNEPLGNKSFVKNLTDRNQ